MPSRRRVLRAAGVVLAGALAGCAEPGGALMMTEVDDDEAIGREATFHVDSSTDPGTWSLLEEICDEGRADVEAERPPFDPDRPVLYRDRVYEVSWTAETERTETGYVVTATVGDDDHDPAIAFEDLPSIDRNALAELPAFVGEYRTERGPDDSAGDEDARAVDENESAPVEPTGDEPTGAESDGSEPASDEPTGDEPDEDEPYRLGSERVGIDVEYDAADPDIASSALVPEPEYEVIAVDGVPVELETRTVERTIEAYRYELEELAASPAGYGARLRERTFELDGLSDDERALVEEAIEEGQAVVGLDDDAFVGVGERLLEEPPINEDEYTGEWLVEYDGRDYWAELDALRTKELVDRLGNE